MQVSRKATKPTRMMNKFRWFSLLALSLTLTGSMAAKFCPKCSRLAYIQAIGECPQCKGFTSSAAHKLCGKCSFKENKCQNCLVVLDAATNNKLSKTLKGPRPQSVQIQPVPAPPRPLEISAPDLVAPPVFRLGGGSPVDKAKVAQLEKSLNTWEALKKECGGNYTYSKRWSSWVGFGHTTEVVAENNKVVERRYKSFSGRPRPVAPGRLPAKPEGTGWTEKGNELGKNKQGHPAKTLDELYKDAAEILGRPVPPFQRLGLRFDKQGLLLACYTQDTRIADDAPTKGVNISSITLQKRVNSKGIKVDAAVTEGTSATVGKGSRKKEIQTLEQKIAKMKDFAKRARFTPEGHRKFLAELSDLEKQLAALKSGKVGVPTYEKWLAGGKRIPPGMVFTGGSPWFNESTGQRRQPREVYDMIFGRTGGKKPPVKLRPIRPRPIKPGAKKSYPKHWGKPPLRQTRDLRPLPGGYGRGSSTLANWIKQKMEQDRNRGNAPD